MRRSAPALAAGLLALLVLVGCGAAPVGPSTDDPTVILSSDRLGVDWHVVDGAVVPTDDFSTTTASTGDTLWMVGDDDLMLHATENGVDWRQIDLREHGLPAEAFLVSRSANCPTWAWKTGGGLAAFYGIHNNGTHPAGIATQMWLVEIHGDDVDVRAAVDIGLEDMPAPQGGFNFRTDCVAGIVDHGGGRMIVGLGQWWQPYKTGASHGYVAFEDANGRWSVHSEYGAPFLGGSDRVTITDVFTLGDRIVVLGGVSGFERYAWSSVDGRAWERYDFPGFDEVSSDIWATTGGDRIVMAAAVAGRIDVWTTTDGVTWSSESLLTGADDPRLELLAHGATGYTLIVSDDVDHIWLSADGATWTPEDPGDGFRSVPGAPTEHAGGLVGFLADSVRVSGLDAWLR